MHTQMPRLVYNEALSWLTPYASAERLRRLRVTRVIS